MHQFRQSTTAATAAQVGRKYHDNAPLRGSAWPRRVKYLANAMLLVFAVVGVAALTVMVIR